MPLSAMDRKRPEPEPEETSDDGIEFIESGTIPAPVYVDHDTYQRVLEELHAYVPEDYVLPNRSGYKPDYRALLALKDILETNGKNLGTWQRSTTQGMHIEKDRIYTVVKGMLLKAEEAHDNKPSSFEIGTFFGGYTFTLHKTVSVESFRNLEEVFFKYIMWSDVPSILRKREGIAQIREVHYIAIPALELKQHEC